MSKDKWIYQDRDVETPWAVYVVKEFEKPATLDNSRLDVTIYSESIANSDNMVAFINWHFDSVAGYVNRLREELLKYGEFTTDDWIHVEIELSKLFFDYKGKAQWQ